MVFSDFVSRCFITLAFAPLAILDFWITLDLLCLCSKVSHRNFLTVLMSNEGELLDNVENLIHRLVVKLNFLWKSILSTSRLGV